MTSHVLPPEPSIRQLHLSDHDLRASLQRFVRRRLPHGDAEDVVQDTLTDALAASRAPEDPRELRKWVFGIARRKVADAVATAPRGQAVPRDSDGAAPAPSEIDAVDMVRWARSEVGEDPDNSRTLGWLVREGLFGETLADIAEQSGLPPATVRQRVSRMRRFLRERWASQLGVAAGLLLLAVGWWVLAPGVTGEPTKPDDHMLVMPTEQRALDLRQRAQSACDQGSWATCEAYLDQAKELDAEGERLPFVMRLREAIRRAVTVPAPPSSMGPPVLEAPVHEAPEPPDPSTKGPAGVDEVPCTCPDYDPMCGCLPGMGRSVVPPDP